MMHEFKVMIKLDTNAVNAFTGWFMIHRYEGESIQEAINMAAYLRFASRVTEVRILRDGTKM